MSFHGAKILLLFGRELVTVQRDFAPNLRWAGMWDLPGGGREGDESPEACVIRETREEISVLLTTEDLIYRRYYSDTGGSWFFAARLPATRVGEIVLGEEGQAWRLQSPAEWVLRDDTVPHFRWRVAEAMEALLGA